MIYQIKITLQDIKPAVWRRALVDPTMTMEELHYVTQSLMGWECAHLYQFTSGKRRIVDSEADDDGEAEFASDLLIGQAFRKAGDKWTYVYDFGDNWTHEIELEKIVDLEPGVEYPVCVDGERACPPEDCGGPMGYMNLLAVIKNPKDPDYSATVDWLGTDSFDPDEFDKEIVNAELHDPENWVDEDDEEFGAAVGEFDDDDYDDDDDDEEGDDEDDDDDEH